MTLWINKCMDCKHRIEGNTCIAFPNKIPESIWTGKNDHSKPLKIQTNEITFEKNSKK